MRRGAFALAVTALIFMGVGTARAQVSLGGIPDVGGGGFGPGLGPSSPAAPGPIMESPSATGTSSLSGAEGTPSGTEGIVPGAGTSPTGFGAASGSEGPGDSGAGSFAPQATPALR